MPARLGAITIINLFLLPRMPPPEGYDRAIQLLSTLPLPTIPFSSYNCPPFSLSLPSLVAVCFSACPFWTKIGPVKNNEVAPTHKLDRLVDSPPPFNGIFTLGGLSARNDHYELWINAYREAYTRCRVSIRMATVREEMVKEKTCRGDSRQRGERYIAPIVLQICRNIADSTGLRGFFF